LDKDWRMGKILFIGDPHIRHTHLSESLELLRWIESVADERRPDLIVNLGDTFDTHAVVRAEVLSLVNSHVRRIVQMKIPLVMLLGNHDMWKPNCNKYHALEVFKSVNGVTVVDEITVADGITYVPYLPNIRDWPSIDTSIAVTHNTFVGADYGFSKCADDGVSPDKVHNDLVVSGHIHKRQSLKEGSIIYPGTPTSLTASDANQTKGLMLLDSASLSIEYVQSPFPMWRTMDILVEDVKDLELNETDRWVIKITGPRAEIRSILESDHIRDLKKRTQVSFRTQFTDSIKLSRTQIVAPTVYNMAEQYVDQVYDGAIDKSNLKSTLRKYTER
jgi:DNA repair exonuclease SbcCD nuclease subunit